MSLKKARQDPRGAHLRLYWRMIDSMAWRALDWSAQGLYIAMRRKLVSGNNGNIEATLGTLRHSGFKSSATLAKGLRALRAVGLIAMTRQGGIAFGQRVCSLYRFTDERVHDQPQKGVKAVPATNEWERFSTLTEARAAVQTAHINARTDKRCPTKRHDDKNGAGLQKLNRTSSKLEPSSVQYLNK